MTQHYHIDWLRQKFESGETLKFLYFWGHSNPRQEVAGKFCLSQWYESPFIVDNICYPTAEHWMMAQKALLFDDAAIFQKIVTAQKPGEVKELGRQIAGFDEQSWNKNRYDIVKQGNFHKFSQHPVLAEYLLKTAPRILAEASPVDKIWGVGLAEDDKAIQYIDAWPGLNLLGFALMEVRDMLKAHS